MFASHSTEWPKWIYECRTKRALLGEDVAAEVHEALDRFGHECRRLRGVGERVRAGTHRVDGARRKDLRLDHARRAVVDCTQDCHRASVLLRVPDEELAPRRLCRARHGTTGAGDVAAVVGVVSDSPAIAFFAACATASRSLKPSSSIAT